MDEKAKREAAEPRLNRREACRSALRCLALGGVTLFSAALICRRRETSDRKPCRTPLACRACKALAGCSLPQALAAQRDTQR